MSEATYKVTLPKDFIAEFRIREGIKVLREGGCQGPLTEEQLEAIKEDSYLTIEEIAEQKPQAAPKAPSKK